jgi:VWFA-related protein
MRSQALRRTMTLVAGGLLLSVAAATQQPVPPPTAAQQRPVFRGGTHFVRVDAYPTKDGRIVEGLGADDFEILEDGKPQKIDSVDFVRFDTFTPDAERRDPSTQREGFDMAADPRYRLFVIFSDLAFSTSAGPFVPNNDVGRIQQPLVNFLDRVLGSQDLYGFLTSRNSVKDLVLARKSTVTRSQILDMWRSSLIDKDDADSLWSCPCAVDVPANVCEGIIEIMKMRHRADATYTALTDLVAQLGSLRQERKNIVFVSNLLPRWPPDNSLLEKRGSMPPSVGINRGRIGTADRTSPGAVDGSYCASEFQRLAMMDFDPKYRELLRQARKENVSFYVITPGGLQAPVTVQGIDALKHATDDLMSLANETDGLAIVNTNDLNAGMKRIADDLAAYYVLGYYTTNTKFDGGLRNIKVRLKANGQAVRARRQYRAPTPEEIARLAAGASGVSSSSPTAGASAPAGPSPIETALSVLERGSRPFAAYAAAAGRQLTVVAELSAKSIETGKWKDGADVEVVASAADGTDVATGRSTLEPGSYSTTIRLTPAATWPARVAVRFKGTAGPSVDDWFVLEPASATLVGDAVAYRSASRVAQRPVATFEFARNERIRAEWPVLATLDRRDVRLLDRTGRALPVDLPLSEDPATHAVVVEMSLSGLGRGDYLIELTAGAGTVVEKRLLAIRIK